MKIFERLVISMILVFAFLNAIIFFVLNSQTVQHTIVDYINANYLSRQNLKLDVGSLSLTFFTGNLNLNEVYIREKNHETSAGKKFDLSFNQISISFNVASSYVKWRPVVQKVLLRGLNLKIPYDAQNNLILPDFLQFNNNTPLDIPGFLKKNMFRIPFDIDILNSTIILGDSEKKSEEHNSQLISISQLSTKKITTSEGIEAIDLSVLAADSSFLFPLKPKITVPFSKIKLILLENGDFSLPQLEIKSSLANVTTTVQGRFESEIEKSYYTANIEKLDLISSEIFQLLHMKSNGIASISGELSSGKTFYDLPSFSGKVDWKDFSLEGFDIYSGMANFYFNNKKIIYEQAVIHTSHDGVILASGKFNLYGSFYFENKARIQNLSFAELLHGLGVSHSPVDFNISAQEAIVAGNIISQNKKKGFELLVQTSGEINKLVVTSLTAKKDRTPLPEMKFKTSLSASHEGISFQQTSASINGKSGQISLEKGIIDFKNSGGNSVYFKIKGNNVDLSAAQYFLSMPISGSANLSAEIKALPNSDGVHFSSFSEVKNAEIFGVKFKDGKGTWGIDSEKIWVENGELFFSENDGKTSSASVSIPHLSFSLSDLYSKISLSVNGNLNGIAAGIRYWIPPVVSQLTGDIRNLSVNMTGLFFHPSTWDLNAKSKIENINIINGQIKSTNIYLNCLKGVCKKSAIMLNDIKRINNNTKEQTSGDVSSFALFEIAKISFEDSFFRARIKNIPLDIFNNILFNKVEGVFSSNIQFSGQWNNLAGFIDANAYNLKYDNLNIGDVNLHILPTEKKHFKSELHAFQNQILVSALTSFNSAESSSVDINLINFDPTLLFSSQVRADQNLYSKISGHFLLEGKDPFRMKGKGILQSAHIQFNKMIFTLLPQTHISLNENILTVDPFQLNEVKESATQIKIAKTSIDFSKQTYAANLSLDSDLKELNLLSDFFGSSDGSLSGDFSFGGTFSHPDIMGNIALKAKSLVFKNYPPALENVEGNITLKNNIFKINSFNAQKGQGTATVSGNINFLHSFINLPEFSINLVAKNADIRFPFPIFQIADSTVSADLSLSGNQIPYSISGDIEVNKLRLFRDISCNDIAKDLLHQNIVSEIISDAKPFADLNINFAAQRSLFVQSQCLHGNFSTAPELILTGNTTTPVLSGNLTTDSATLLIFKTPFTVKQADFSFIELQKYTPNVNIRMESRVSSYTLSMNINGRLSVARVDLSIDPQNLANGDRMTQADILSIISTGHIPLQSSSANLLAVSTGAFSIFGIQNIFENTLNNQLSNVTGGFIDNASLAPTTQYGQLGARLSVSKALSNRLDLGMSYENGGYGTDRSAYATFMFNDTVSAISSIDDSAILEQRQRTGPEFFSGLRFRFGSQ